MFKKIFRTTCMLSVLLSATFSVNASMISVGGVELNALDLNGTHSSFNEFYGFTLSDYSSHTGYETADVATVMFAELNNEYAMFLMISGPGGAAGAVSGDVSGSEGAISFIDDPGGRDPVSGSSISWTYAANKTDGLIFSGITSDVWTIDVNLTKVSGGFTGVNFLTFDNIGNDTKALSLGLTADAVDFSINSIQSTAVAAVNAPATFGLFFIALAGFLRLRRK